MVLSGQSVASQKEITNILLIDQGLFIPPRHDRYWIANGCRGQLGDVWKLFQYLFWSAAV